MADNYGRSVSRLRPGVTIGQVKRLVKDKIAETLNLASVDPDEIVVFGKRSGELKASNISLDDILIKRRNAVEDSIALFSSDGKLKPGEHVSTITDKLSTVDNAVKSLSAKYAKPLQEFLCVPPTTTPNLATIKAAIDNLAKLRSDYDTHIAQFGTLRKTVNRADDAIDNFFSKINVKPDDVKTTLDDIAVKFNEITAMNRLIETITAIKDEVPRVRDRVDQEIIPHRGDYVNTVQHREMDWVSGNDNMINFTTSVKDI